MALEGVRRRSFILDLPPMLLQNLENILKNGWRHDRTNVEAIHLHFITQRNLLSQSYHSTFSNKYEVRTRQYDGRKVTKKGGVVKLNKRVTDAQKENDGNRRLRAASGTRLQGRQGREQMPSESLSTPLRSARVVCFLVCPGLKVTEVGSTVSDARSPPRCLLRYNLIWWKGERFGALPLQTGRQWVNESTCPLRGKNDSVYPPQFTATPRNPPLPLVPPSFRHADRFKTGLHSPGHLGWWSPRPHWPGTSQQRRLEGNTSTKKTAIQEGIFLNIYENSSGVLTCKC